MTRSRASNTLITVTTMILSPPALLRNTVSTLGLFRTVRCMSLTSSAPKLQTSLLNPALLRSAILDPDDSSDDKNHFAVSNPADASQILALVPKQTAEQAKQMIQASSDALPCWRDDTTAQERSRRLLEWSRLCQENAEDLAIIMTLESGKPLAESRGEVQYARSFLDYFAAEAIRSTGAGGGTIVPTPFSGASVNGNFSPRGRAMAIQQAVGVTALITPWNFPVAMITRKAGPALAAGCTAVIKPSELTPLTALALEQLALEAGIPPAAMQIVTTDRNNTPHVGHELCTNELVRKISFTGSTAVGKQLYKWASGTVKRLSLELGGNAPFVVFEDADLDQAVQAAMASKFRNAGQTCVCADRFLVHATVHDDFISRLGSAMQGIAVGSGLDEGVTMGPLISADAVEKLHAKVKAALQEGATCLAGGKPLTNMGPQFYAPTLLTDVAPDMDIWRTETFGPVAAIRRFETEEEALALANDSSVGLAAYFLTNDLSRAFRFSERLECGIVGLNDGIISTCSLPFGGVKESGLGREGSWLGLSEYLETKYIFMNV